MTTLTYSGTTITLPADLYWADEASWQPVVQTAERTITGALVIQTHVRIAGRPITLQPPGDNGAWITRETLDGLTALAAIPGAAMTLTLRGVPRQVVWRHQEEPVIDAQPVMHYADVQEGDFYTATLRFMEI